MKVKLVTITFLCVAILSVMVGYFLSVKKNGSLPIIQNQTHEKTSQNFHRSFFSQSDLFDESFGALEYIPPKDTSITKGLVVNHHLLAPQFIARAFQTVATDKPITVVILSPNHFSVGKGQMLSYLYNIQTPYGVLDADQNIIEQLRAQGIIKIEEAPFENEHGVSNLVAFIKKTIPNAKIVPILIKDTSASQENERLANLLRAFLPQDALVVASLDFSHYLPGNVAEFHDVKSLAVLDNFDYEGIASLDIDSKPTLTTFLKYLEYTNAQAFTLLDHSNSAKIVEDETLLEITSYITGFFTIGGKNGNPQVSILSFGDLLLGGDVQKAVDEKDREFPFKKVTRLFTGNDITLANLEGSFLDSSSELHSVLDSKFIFNPGLVPVLNKLGFNMLSLSNDHVLSSGREGLRQSQEHLSQYHIDYFGDPNNRENLSVIKDIRGTRVGLVGYRQSDSAHLDEVIKSIEEIKSQTDFIVAYVQWDSGFQGRVSDTQQREARRIIDAGADVVLGSYPTMIQSPEIYNNKAIFYSLGNLLSDQLPPQNTPQGLAVGIVVHPSWTEYYLFPTEIKNSQILLPEKSKSDILLQELARGAQGSAPFLEHIAQGKIFINN